MKGRILGVAVMCAAIGIACSSEGGGPTSFIPNDVAGCGSSTTPFSVLPIDASNIMGWVPLGALNPPGHTFPTDHQYIYLNNFSTGNAAVPLYAPGKIIVTAARRVRYSTGGEDYGLEFTPCRDISVTFGHVKSLSSALLSALGPFDQQCSAYSPSPGLSVTDCYTRRVEVDVSAGEVIGATAGLDLLLFDSRVTPLRYANASRWISNASGFDHFHVAPFSDYFAEPARSSVRALLGSFDGRTHRTVEPLGGSIASDLAGTAQGTWFNASQPTYPETPHLSIVPDNVDPTRIDVSIGGSQPGMASGAYTFAPSATGTVNRDPSTITPGAALYCWEIGYGATDRRGVVLVQLPDAQTLVMEARPGAARTCAAEEPLAFTNASFTYKR